MPIYEYYCSKCNMVLNFLSKSVKVRREPACPHCGKARLERLYSTFSVGGNMTEPAKGNDFPIDESRMERAVTALAGEVEKIGDDDPRKAAGLMKKFTDMTGLEMGRGMKEAVSRLEAGEDPAKIESEMGNLIEGEEEPFILPEGKGSRRGKKGAKPPPRRDSKLYEM
jgi:putative FmdB family regulatory protein